jgi:purine-binding chemotaxis protein CheW
MRVDKRSRAQAATAPIETKHQFLAFGLGEEAFAVDIRSVREVIQYGGITPVPLMPGFIRGVINLRGAVVPVVDLDVRLGRAPMAEARRTCITILAVETPEGPAELGMMVDSVSEVLEIGASEIEPAPTFGSSLRSGFVAGVGRVGGRFVILLDVSQVLSVEELATLAGER